MCFAAKVRKILELKRIMNLFLPRTKIKNIFLVSKKDVIFAPDNS